MASMLRSTSASVVAQEETEMRIAGWPRRMERGLRVIGELLGDPPAGFFST
jgi:hypothetical protein